MEVTAIQGELQSMKYIVPIMFCMALALPSLPVLAAADMSCVKGDCKKTDPAKEAEKEMNKAAGIDVPIEAPVEQPAEGAAQPSQPAATAKALSPMKPDDAIREVQDAVSREASQRAGGTSYATGYAPSTQSGSCSPFDAAQRAFRDRITAEQRKHEAAQKPIADKVTDAQRFHIEEQLRISKVVTDNSLVHQARQKEVSAASAEYQRRLKEEGLVLRQRLADYAEELKPQQDKLRCLTFEQMVQMRK